MLGTTKKAKMRQDKGAERHGKEKKGEEEARKGVGLAIHTKRGLKVKRKGAKNQRCILWPGLTWLFSASLDAWSSGLSLNFALRAIVRKAISWIKYLPVQAFKWEVKYFFFKKSIKVYICTCVHVCVYTRSIWNYFLVLANIYLMSAHSVLSTLHVLTYWIFSTILWGRCNYYRHIFQMRKLRHWAIK